MAHGKNLLALTYRSGLERKVVTPKKLFNLFAKLEAVTWTLLISALTLRAFNVDPLVVTIAGGTHGAIFLSYAVTALLVGINQRWKVRLISLAVILAIVPYATIPLERKLNRGTELLGSWRTTASDRAEDSFWIDRLFRWFIARPFILLLTLILGLTAIFAFLLFLGPPDQWFKSN